MRNAIICFAQVNITDNTLLLASSAMLQCTGQQHCIVFSAVSLIETCLALCTQLLLSGYTFKSHQYHIGKQLAKRVVKLMPL